MSRRDIDAIEQELIVLRNEVDVLKRARLRQEVYENGYPNDVATEYVTPVAAPSYFVIPIHTVGDLYAHRVQLVARAGGVSAVTRCALYVGGLSFHTPWINVPAGTQDRMSHTLRRLGTAVNSVTVGASTQLLTFDFEREVPLTYGKARHYFAIITTDVTTLRLAVAEKTLLIGSAAITPTAVDIEFQSTMTMPTLAVATPYIRVQSVVGSRMDSGY